MPDPTPTRIPTVRRERRDDANLVHTGFPVYSEIRYSISDSNEAHQWLIRPCEPTSWRLLFSHPLHAFLLTQHTLYAAAERGFEHWSWDWGEHPWRKFW